MMPQKVFNLEHCICVLYTASTWEIFRLHDELYFKKYTIYLGLYHITDQVHNLSAIWSIGSSTGACIDLFIASVKSGQGVHSAYTFS